MAAAAARMNSERATAATAAAAAVRMVSERAMVPMVAAAGVAAAAVVAAGKRGLPTITCTARTQQLPLTIPLPQDPANSSSSSRSSPNLRSTGSRIFQITHLAAEVVERAAEDEVIVVVLAVVMAAMVTVKTQLGLEGGLKGSCVACLSCRPFPSIAMALFSMYCRLV
jgi:hypothetical protein